ncbi:MAG TPA: DUF302 domain-containing protein [bacterium]|nr:DUF302 domain-containing protein [bacterium]
MTQTAYGFGTSTRLPYDETVARVRALLQEEGFGVLTEIDVKKTMKQKLDADFRRYVILGACNPRLAHRAFQAELEIGLLLPCNVVVYEDGDHSVVSVMDPLAALRIAGNETLQPIAQEARAALERVIKRVGGA